MIPLKVPNVELQSGKLPAAYRIDPVMLGNPWHGVVRIDGAGNATLTTNTGKVLTVDFGGGSTSFNHTLLWKHPSAPGAPAWLTAPNPDPSTGKEYTDYCLYTMWMGDGNWPLFLYPTTAIDGSGNEKVVFEKHGGWLLAASDGRNWRVEVLSATHDGATDTCEVKLRLSPWGVVERNTPASQDVTVTCPGGQAGGPAFVYVYYDESATRWLSVMDVSESGRRACFGLGYQNGDAVGWLGVYEISLDVLADGTISASLTLVADRAACVGSRTVNINSVWKYRDHRAVMSTTDNGDGTSTTVIDNVIWEDRPDATSSSVYWEEGSWEFAVNGMVIGAYYDGEVLEQVKASITRTATSSATESWSATGSALYDTTTNTCISDDRSYTARVDYTASTSLTWSISAGARTISGTWTADNTNAFTETEVFADCSGGSTSLGRTYQFNHTVVAGGHSMSNGFSYTNADNPSKSINPRAGISFDSEKLPELDPYLQFRAKLLYANATEPGATTFDVDAFCVQMRAGVWGLVNIQRVPTLDTTLDKVMGRKTTASPGSVWPSQPDSVAFNGATDVIVGLSSPPYTSAFAMENPRDGTWHYVDDAMYAFLL